MNTRKLIVTALLTAFAMVAFIIEGAIPPITPIYGIKLGLANVFTLFALYFLGKKEAMAVLFLRIILGSIFAGQLVSFSYSITGGLLSFLVMISLKRFFSVKNLWALSVICAVVHNAGQLIMAVLLTGAPQIFLYFPILVVSGIIAGAFTGLCAQFVLIRIDKIKR